jgi:hypothetical protein
MQRTCESCGQVYRLSTSWPNERVCRDCAEREAAAEEDARAELVVESEEDEHIDSEDPADGRETHSPAPVLPLPPLSDTRRGVLIWWIGANVVGLGAMSLVLTFAPSTQGPALGFGVWSLAQWVVARRWFDRIGW